MTIGDNLYYTLKLQVLQAKLQMNRIGREHFARNGDQLGVDTLDRDCEALMNEIWEVIGEAEK